ncbi:SspB-related isopeptide-forming adhesin, partial [Ligilactobacillus sp. LYQ139]|uniref:SspB-related isopeptide-forming adhesin n=1 Tax=Ligilactobacillus sp. LYQ139 TaxID=3378800 RepID=UPI0038543A28
MQKQLQGDLDSQAAKISQQLSTYEQQKAAYDKARSDTYNAMGDTISGDDFDAARPVGLVNSGINNTQGVPAEDSLQHAGNHVIYCTQPYGVGPGVDGTPDHVTLNTGIQGNADQQRTIAGILYLGKGGPGDNGTYSEMDTHFALSYYLYHNNLANIKNWENQNEGVTDQIADKWLHYGKVQQLLNAAGNWDKDGTIMYRLYSGHADNEDHGNHVAGSRGSQLLVAGNFAKSPVAPQVPHFMYHEDKLYTDTPKAIKKVTNDEGFNVNGKKLMRGDKANYKLTWDLSGDKGLDITPGMKVAGLSISDTLPAQVGLDANGITITDG